MSSARAILEKAIAEAEDPKRFIHGLPHVVWRGGALFDARSDALLGGVFFYAKRPATTDRRGRGYFIPAQGDDKWHMMDVRGVPHSVYSAPKFDTEEEAKTALLALLKETGLLGSRDPLTAKWRRTVNGWQEYFEGEEPKDVLRNNSLAWKLRELIAKEDERNTPPDDAFRDGQRVRRTQLNPFGARPFGGEPNDIGDLGTVRRFVGREEEPRHALYLVRWDRCPMDIQYISHDALEAAE